MEKAGEAAAAVADLGPAVAEGLKRAAARKDLQSGSAQEKHDAASRLLDSYGGGRLPTDVRQGLADQIGALAEQNPQQAAQAMDVMQRLLAQSQGGKQDFAQILEAPLVMALGAALVASTPQGQEAWQKVAPQLSDSMREDVQKLAVYLLLLNPVSSFSTGSITTLPIADLGPLRPLGYPADNGADKADPGSAGYGAGGKVELPGSTGGSRIDESGGWSTTTPEDPVSGLGSVYSSANSDGGLKSTNIVIDTKIGSQLTGRGWTEQDIRAVVEAGAVGTTVDKRSASKTPDGLPRNDSASVYGSKTGYVVVNDRTGEIVQVSGKNDPGWIPDSRINWK